MEFLIQAGHEPLLWRMDDKFWTLPMGHYRPERSEDFRLHSSVDGLHFTVNGPEVRNIRQGKGRGLRAPGCYRPDLTGQPESERIWGLSMSSYSGDPGLIRWELEIAGD